MSRFKKQSHTIWFCEYHIVWCPKYRYRVLAGKLKEEVELCVRDQTRQMECEVVELKVQADHVHLGALIPPKVRIADYMGRVKGKAAIRWFSVFRDLRRRPYWGNHFGVEGYCVATVGLDEEKIRQYVKYQERQERRQEEFRFGQ
jgi:putative transposase